MGLLDFFRKRATNSPGPAKTFNWQVGQKVLAQWAPERWFYPATIQDVVEPRCRVSFEDGDRAWVFAFQALPLELPIGGRVEARWRGGPNFFPGEIARQDGARIFIQYDDGDSEWTTHAVVRVARPGAGLSPEVMLADAEQERGTLAALEQSTNPEGDIRKLTSLLERVADPTLTLMRRSDLHSQRNEDSQALKDLDQAVATAVRPDILALTFIQRSRCHHKSERFDLAEADARRALEVEPGNSTALCQLALLLLVTRRQQAAIDAATRCLAIDPNDVIARMTRGQCLMNFERYSEAYDDLDRACRLHPTSIVPRKHRGMCAMRMADPDRAIPDLTAAIDQGETYPLAFRGRMYEQLGRFDKALADFDAMLKIDPSAVGLHEDRLRCFRGLGRLDLAAETVRQMDREAFAEVRDIASKGVRLKPGFIMANSVLFDPTSEINSMCRTLITFDPSISAARLQELANLLGTFRYSDRTDLESQYLAELTAVEGSTTSRYRLPDTITGGANVYTADVWVYRRFLRDGAIQTADFWCVAEPGPKGRIAMLPVQGCPALSVTQVDLPTELVVA